jgi:hypothetical protein
MVSSGLLRRENLKSYTKMVVLLLAYFLLGLIPNMNSTAYKDSTCTTCGYVLEAVPWFSSASFWSVVVRAQGISYTATESQHDSSTNGEVLLQAKSSKTPFTDSGWRDKWDRSWDEIDKDTTCNWLNILSASRFVVFTPVKMKNAVFWDMIMSCCSCKKRRFGGTHRLHLQG